MPWCDACERFSNPNSLSEEGGCPNCGTVIAEPADEGEDTAGLSSIPWHFWLVLFFIVVYLGWRVIQLIGVVIGEF